MCEAGGRRGGHILLDYPELLHQDGSELLDNVWPVVRTLKLDDDSLDDLIIDTT